MTCTTDRFEHMTLRLIDVPKSFGIVNRHGLTVATFEVDEADPQYDALMKVVNDGTKVTINITHTVEFKWRKRNEEDKI